MNIKYNSQHFSIDLNELKFDLCDVDSYKTMIDMYMNENNLNKDIWSFEKDEIEQWENEDDVLSEYNEDKKLFSLICKLFHLKFIFRSFFLFLSKILKTFFYQQEEFAKMKKILHKNLIG